VALRVGMENGVVRQRGAARRRAPTQHRRVRSARACARRTNGEGFATQAARAPLLGLPTPVALRGDRVSPPKGFTPTREQMRLSCLGVLAVRVAGESDSPVLELTEANFDVLLREVPVALVAYVNPTTDLHYPSLRPTLRSLAAAFEYAGVGVGRVSSEHNELLDRFQVDAFPTLHWLDGSKKWPYYASEAAPERYEGPRSLEALTSFVQTKTGISPGEQPRAADDAEAASTDAPSDHASEVLSAVAEHDCVALSAVYRACLRHRPVDYHKQLCASERHEYLLCMTGRWGVHRDHHRELARIYGERFA
jgi:hypothetical protein